MVVFGSWNNYLYALDKATGKMRWEYKTYAQIATGPAISDSIIFFSAHRMVYGLDINTGEVVWTYS